MYVLSYHYEFFLIFISIVKLLRRLIKPIEKRLLKVKHNEISTKSFGPSYHDGTRHIS
ncbi:hypothetical protein VCRA2120O333_30250 [Vibrio crassostreae]|nr:hypothetical protein VCRA2113O325_10115 [Vibrio crassostreae]CAK3902847.1 hypothetical protein VCRA2120O333_30250 [Vibrio crassostreae]